MVKDIRKSIQHFFGGSLDSLIAHIKSDYAVEFSSESLQKLESIAQQRSGQISKFEDCLTLLKNAHLLGNLKEHEEEAEDYLYTLKWLIAVSERGTPERIFIILTQLEEYKLLNQESLDKLQKRKNEKGFLTPLKKVLLFFAKHRPKGACSSDLQSLVKYCLTLDREALSRLYGSASLRLYGSSLKGRDCNLNAVLHEHLMDRMSDLAALITKLNVNLPKTQITEDIAEQYVKLRDLLVCKPNAMPFNSYVKYACILDKINEKTKLLKKEMEENNPSDDRRAADEEAHTPHTPRLR